jgi:hypothetical protein
MHNIVEKHISLNIAPVWSRVANKYYNSVMPSYIDTYHSRFIPVGKAEVVQEFFQDAHILYKLLSYENDL